jgi:hypothetical protein
MEKQTAVEWLIDQILVEYDTYFNEEGDLVDKPINQFFNAYKSSVNLIEYVKQAKEMEKQQIINCYNKSWHLEISHTKQQKNTTTKHLENNI